MPNRTEVIERLRKLAADERFMASWDDLTQAADLLEAGEGRTEYRVVGDVGLTLYYREGDLDRALRQRNYAQAHGRPAARIQQRTVTQTEWEDVDDEEDQ